jgi:hypothetical protein
MPSSYFGCNQDSTQKTDLNKKFTYSFFFNLKFGLFKLEVAMFSAIRCPKQFYSGLYLAMSSGLANERWIFHELKPLGGFLVHISHSIKHGKLLIYRIREQKDRQIKSN